jgi:hypothetical protein
VVIPSVDVAGVAAHRRAPAVVVGVCAAIAVASLAIPVSIAYDPWAWLVWGREVGRLQLDTLGGPSWKPLPVLPTTVLAWFGSAAPTLWLVLARFGGLLAVVGVYRLAARFAGVWAGVIAAAMLVLSPDPGPRYVRLILEGHSAPVTVALTVWAIDRHLDGKHASALVLATALALDRPEAWPFLGLYALWLWRHDPACRRLAVAMLAGIPVLWFGADWWGSGSPIHGADAARVIADEGGRLIDSARRVGEVVSPVAWCAALIAVVDAVRRRETALPVLAAGALAWFALVVAMSAVFGYAALSRFLLPGAAILCVLAGIGVVRLFAMIPTGGLRVAVAIVVVVVSAPLLVWRADGIRGQLDEVEARARQVDGLDRVIGAAGGPDAVTACGRVAIDDADVPRVAAAWKLDVPLEAVHRRLGREPGVVLASRPRRAERRAARHGHDVTVVAATDGWAVLATGCTR